ncbi:MAG: hypothetical protein R3186_05120, partial [Ruegeria sp.]|nr:hypothetical protein [Ruegeria sp.]
MGRPFINRWRTIMKIEDGRKTLATRDDLKRLGIHVSRTTLLRWEARGRFPRRISLRRRDQILSRFEDHRMGMAAAVGAEAWTQGAQVLFVSLNEEASVAG